MGFNSGCWAGMEARTTHARRDVAGTKLGLHQQVAPWAPISRGRRCPRTRVVMLTGVSTDVGAGHHACAAGRQQLKTLREARSLRRRTEGAADLTCRGIVHRRTTRLARFLDVGALRGRPHVLLGVEEWHDPDHQKLEPQHNQPHPSSGGCTARPILEAAIHARTINALIPARQCQGCLRPES